LVVVGDVDTQEIFALAEQYFGHIEPNLSYKKQKNFFNQDIATQAVTLYRDVQQPCLAYAFVVDGAMAKNDHTLQITEWILGKGKGSRLYKKLINYL
jgi:predicted Zn-dependent peptidase